MAQARRKQVPEEGPKKARAKTIPRPLPEDVAVQGGTEIVTVSPVVGEGPEARRIIKVGKIWELSQWQEWADGEARIRDVDLAIKLGFGQPRDIRKLIKRYVESGDLPDVRMRATVARIENPHSGGVREVAVDEFWLTHEEAGFIIAKSETPIAKALLKAILKVFFLAAQGLLKGPDQAALERKVEALQLAVATITSESEARLHSTIKSTVALVMRENLHGRVLPIADKHGADNIKWKLKEYGRLMALALPGTSAKSWRSSGDVELRSSIGYEGLGRRFELMSFEQYACSFAVLEGMILRAEKMVRATGRSSNGGQRSMWDILTPEQRRDLGI